MPFGVELPDNLGNSEGAPNAQPESSQNLEPQVSKAEQPETTTAPEPKSSEPLDLDKLERFRFNGREWSPKDLKSAYMMREDYTRKTQELSEARKYAENFEADLQTVLRDPARLNDLKSVYPRSYVELAERYLGSRPAGQTSQPAQTAQPETRAEYEKRIAQLENRIQDWDKAQHQAEVTKIQSWLDNQFENLSKKYPLANTEVINARAEVLVNQGTQITDKVLDKLFKANNEEIKAVWEKHYKTKVNDQITTGQKGKDMGAGGGVPGQAPKGPKTMREARDQWLEDLARK